MLFKMLRSNRLIAILPDRPVLASKSIQDVEFSGFPYSMQVAILSDTITNEDRFKGIIPPPFSIPGIECYPSCASPKTQEPAPEVPLQSPYCLLSGAH